ncbi:MAG: glycoside hydrolase, partial [bacterium]|nr:glycoside hydrolase [bacterium]
EAWRNILLYDEHTWGSWNSISEPYVDFTIQQWEKKRTFVQNSERLSSELLDSALEAGDNALTENRAIDVYNTNSWSRTDVVYLPESISGEGDRIRDEQGNYLPSQRLSSGELAVLVKDIPAMGMKRFLIEDGDDESNDRVVVENDFISNGILSVKIDDNTGNISSIRDESTGTEYVRTSDDLKFNGYYYVPGRDPKEKETVSNVRISIKDNGPLIGSLIIESDAPGSNSLKREIRLFNGIDRIDIINTVDKKDIYDPEGVHFAYPFSIPGGQVRIDLAWGMFRPEYDQLKGANKNYFSAQRWVDVSNDENGVTMALVDAPLIEVGKITNDPIVVGWKEQAENSQTILSYVMNNYWETNYKASQGGNAVFRYSLLPHRQFNTGDAKRFGIERSQPLIAVQSSENTPVKDSFLSLSNKNIVLTSMKPIGKNKKALLVRLFNTSEKEETTTIEWKGIKHGAVSPYFPFSDDIGLISDRITLKPFEVITLYVELK